MGNPCCFCGKEAPEHHNYCSWRCHINAAKASGGKEICPNGLKITCIRHDGAMMENAYADHPDYRFPVTVEFVGERDPNEHEAEYSAQDHAVIYTDGNIVLTLCDAEYFIWHLLKNKCLSSKNMKDRKIKEEDRVKILELAKSLEKDNVEI